jgi:transposase
MAKGVSNKRVFKPYNPQQDAFFPVSISQFIHHNHPVRTISNVVEQLDLSSIYNSYDGGGASRYDPKMMLKIIIYAYFNNVYSCRAIANFIRENTHAMWLSGSQFPDFRTINSFRSQRIKDEIDNIFSNITKLLIQEGLISIDNVFIDGSKFESAANRYTFVWRKNVEKGMDNIEKKINAILKEINEIMQCDERNIDLPEEIKEVSAESISATVERINQKLLELEKQADKAEHRNIKKARTRVNKIKTEMLDKYNNYQHSLDILGDRNSYSKTDNDATFMRMKNDLLRPGYNVQLSTENQIILNYSVHQNADDTSTFVNHIESFKAKYDTMPNTMTGDAAYGSLENYNYLADHEIENYLKYSTFYKESTKKYQYDISKSDNLYYNEEENYYVCPMGQKMYEYGSSIRKTKTGYQYEVTHYKATNCRGCPLRGACHKSKGERIIEINRKLQNHKRKARENLNSEKGRKLRRQRNFDVEPVFGHIKSNRKGDRFRLRGLEKVNLEIGLFSIVHNLKKLHKAKLVDFLFFIRFMQIYSFYLSIKRNYHTILLLTKKLY